MNKEYPDEKQRYSICLQQSKKKSIADEIRDEIKEILQRLK
jgi:hypothetical protein